MSLFRNCESCSKVGTRVCRCENSAHFFCDSHVANHILYPGAHSVESCLETLSSSEVSSIGEAYQKYQLSSLSQAVNIRNSRIEQLLKEIRMVDEECSSILETISNGPIAKDVQQVLSNQALPLVSDSYLVQSLLDLKHGPSFSSPKIFDFFISLNYSLLSPFSSFFSTPASYSKTHPPSTDSVQRSSSKTGASQRSSTQMMADPTNYRWELFQQKKTNNDLIRSIAVSDCEKYVASASGNDPTIMVCELQTLRPIHTLTGHTGSIYSVAFLGHKIVSGSEDKTIKIWEVDRCVSNLYCHSDIVVSVCVSSCKRFIVSGSQDKSVVVFSLELNEKIQTLMHSNEVLSVALSPDNKEVVSGSGEWKVEGLISIWRIETGELLKIFSAHSSYVTSVSFSGKLIASSSDDKSVKIWDRNNNQALLTFTDHAECTTSVDISDNIVASLGIDEKIIVRDIRNGTVIQILTTPFIAHSAITMGLKVLKGGKFIVSGGVAGNLRVWKRIN